MAALGKDGGSKRRGLKATIRDAVAQSVGNAAKAMVPCMKDAGGTMATYLRGAGGIKVLVDLLHFDGPGRKNVAIVIARLASNPDNMAEIRAHRGMEILCQIGGSLV